MSGSSVIPTSRALGAGLSINFSFGGSLILTTGIFKWYNDTGRTLIITKVRASVGTAPAGTTIIVDVKKNGITVFPTTAKPTIAIAGLTITATPDIVNILNGDFITVDIAQVGSTIPGANLFVNVVIS